MHILTLVSNSLLAIEKRIVVVLMVSVFGLILLNVVTRTFSYALYWVDELAIYAMIWLVFMGASIAVRTRQRIAVTLILDALPHRYRQWVDRLLDVVIFLFSALLLYLSWRWYDLPGLVAVDFDFEIFAMDSFNFIYDEPTNTLGFNKSWVWSIIPVYAFTSTIHSLLNLIESVTAGDDELMGEVG